MTLSKQDVLSMPSEFLGKTWDWVIPIATNPMMFPDRVIEAHKVLTQ